MIRSLLPAAVLLFSCGAQDADHAGILEESMPASAVDSSFPESMDARTADTDVAFMVEAANAATAAITLGQLALQNSVNPAVKELGKMVVADHSASNEVLKLLAAGKGVVLPSAPDAGRQKAARALSSERGVAFEGAYLRQMIEDQEHTIELFEAAHLSVKDPAIQDFIVQTLPVLRTHLLHSGKLYAMR